VAVLDQIAASGLVPVVKLERAEDAPELARTLAVAGLPCIEITFRTAAAAAAIRAIRAEVPEVLVGAGTVVSLDQLERALDAGAAFVVSPGLSAEVVRACLDRSVPVLPGVYTPTEVIHAMDLGLSAMKLFPASSAGGAAYLRALGGPFPQVRFVPTGGIDLGDLEAYLRVPSVLAVGGSWMVRPELLVARDWAAVGRLAQEATALVRTVRAGQAQVRAMATAPAR
jgi:2-dehydro-3-deoxyphosphogluconate aldolase/(4S)-4-hydroxy-2-oxoglutarate aldolase